jgi:hypothetical protein
MKRAIQLWIISVLLGLYGQALSEESEAHFDLSGNDVIFDMKHRGGVFYPKNFKVWVGEYYVFSTPAPNTKEVIIPTNNDNSEKPNCYIACYARESTHAVYGGPSLFDDLRFVVSQIGVPGRYVYKVSKSVCSPKGFENVDLSTDHFFKELCAKKFPEACGNEKCWADGETDWFGIGQ